MYDLKQELCQIIKSLPDSIYSTVNKENLLSFILKSDYYSNLNNEIDVHAKRLVKALEFDLRRGRPIQYCLGEAYFMDLVLFVDERVLIPRPETEELTDWVSKDYRHREGLKILEIGTGSGCISIQLAKYFHKASITAIEFSEDALEVAKLNALKYSVEITFKKMDFLNSKLDLQEKWDIIISNPPYVSIEDAKHLDLSVLNFEPQQALFAEGVDPDIFYRKIANYGRLFLKEGGAVYCELNQFRYQEILQIFRKELYSKVELRKDLQDNMRMLKAVFK